MISFIVRRMLSAAFLILVISALAFTLLYVGAGDIARRLLGQNASQETVALKAEQLGVDRPIPEQYLSWLTGAVRGDLGRSWFTGQEVSNAISTRLGVSLSLVIGAIIITAVFAVAIGVWAAVRRGWVDRVLQVLSVLGGAAPGFLVALGLVLVFALQLKLFKPTGFVPITTSFSGWVSTVTLPIVALAIGGVAGVSQQVRGAVIDALRDDYVRTLRSRGLSPARIILKHVLRNAGGSALSVLSLLFVAMLGGTVIVEQMFAIPGLGQVAVIATGQGDVPLVMGLVIVTAIIVAVVNLIIDLLQGALNPKVRVS